MLNEKEWEQLSTALKTMERVCVNDIEFVSLDNVLVNIRNFVNFKEEGEEEKEEKLKRIIYQLIPPKYKTILMGIIEGLNEVYGEKNEKDNNQKKDNSKKTRKKS